jgi:hypothetical protein
VTPDPTEQARRERMVELNPGTPDRAALEAKYGQVWDTEELSRDFEVLGFQAPFVVVRRKEDMTVGSLEFQHHPRFYFNWKADI